MNTETIDLITFVRLELYNRDRPCGSKAIADRLKQTYGLRVVPSPSVIARVLSENGLTHGRTGWYEGEAAPTAMHIDAASG